LKSMILSKIFSIGVRTLASDIVSPEKECILTLKKENIRGLLTLGIVEQFTDKVIVSTSIRAFQMH